jgi:patatin-like phospholipase/acyl hydrolase
MTYRILSLDGGGIRGLITTIILERLEKLVPGWLDEVDLIAGTSTGGIIALGLAHGLSPSEMRELYEKKGPRIFKDTMIDDLLDLWKLVGADYSNRYLRAELKSIFGQTTLGELGKHVLVAAFELMKQPDPDDDQAEPTWDAKFFHNFPGPDSDAGRLAYKVALYTSAAPTYFPSVDGFIDGGVVANNPSMAALVQTQDRRCFDNPPPLGELSLLSLGTGRPAYRIKRKRVDWGIAQWAPSLLNMLLDGVMQVAHY